MKTGWKKKIEEILTASITPGSPLFSKDHYRIYREIHGILEDHKLKLLFPYEMFSSKYSVFMKSQIDHTAAVNQFIIGMEKPSRPAYLNLKTLKIKKVRATEHEEFKRTWELLGDVSIVTWFLLPDEVIKDDKFMCRFWGLPFSKKSVKTIKDYINSLKRFMFSILGWLPLLAQMKPAAKPWIVDIFGTDSKLYMPNWEQHRRKSKNLPGYKKSLELYLRFIIDKETPKQLGLAKKWNNFTERFAPQGQIKILRGVHNLFFYGSRYNKIKNEKMQHVRNLFSNTPRFIYRDVLKQLYNEEFQPLDYILSNPSI